VSVHDLGDEEVHQNEATFPAALYDAIVPSATPSGRPIRRTCSLPSHEGESCTPGMAGIPLTTRPDFVQIPIRGLPPIPVGLIWRNAHENARICALAAAARAIYPHPPAGTDAHGHSRISPGIPCGDVTRARK
jgi:hypothetical protein